MNTVPSSTSPVVAIPTPAPPGMFNPGNQSIPQMQQQQQQQQVPQAPIESQSPQQNLNLIWSWSRDYSQKRWGSSTSSALENAISKYRFYSCGLST